mmetsp:Transcript_2899/g.8428  ORF Transcript_2899/g.8428 Transcript_2899/m.8428 type:complete len:445 (+) Transcript_2899:247-1581(+)
MASTPRNGIADLSLEDDDSIKKMSEVAKFARQNNIPGYRPNGHHPVPKPQKQRSENSIRETPMSALRRRLSGWFGLSTSKPPRRANSLPGKISRDDSEHALSELKQSLSQSPRWQRRRKSVPKPPPKPRMPPPPPRTAPCSDWRELQSARGIAQALRAGRRQLVVFLDYDGTLTPIVSDPDAATLSDHMRDAVGKLSDRATVAIVSGRAREKLRNFVQLPELYYAGSHGFDIDGPGGLRHSVSSEMVPVLRAARDLLIERLQVIEGSSVEDNRFSVSVHWRNVAPTDRPAVEAIVDSTLREAPFAGVLRKNSGKCVYELRPDVKWDKGEAVLYLLELLRRRETDFDEYGDDDGVPEERIAGFTEDEWYGGVLPVYVGDDVTDEDAFKAIAPFGAVSVLVCPSGDKVERPRATHATHTLKDVDDVRAFVDELASACAARPSVRGR